MTAPVENLLTALRLVEARRTLQARGDMDIEIKTIGCVEHEWHVKDHLGQVAVELRDILGEFDAAQPQEDQDGTT